MLILVCGNSTYTVIIDTMDSDLVGEKIFKYSFDFYYLIIFTTALNHIMRSCLILVWICSAFTAISAPKDCSLRQIIMMQCSVLCIKNKIKDWALHKGIHKTAERLWSIRLAWDQSGSYKDLSCYSSLFLLCLLSSWNAKLEYNLGMILSLSGLDASFTHLNWWGNGLMLHATSHLFWGGSSDEH